MYYTFVTLFFSPLRDGRIGRGGFFMFYCLCDCFYICLQLELFERYWLFCIPIVTFRVILVLEVGGCFSCYRGQGVRVVLVWVQIVTCTAILHITYYVAVRFIVFIILTALAGLRRLIFVILADFLGCF